MLERENYSVEASIRLLNAKTAEEVKKALDAGADPNATDENGKTALMVACQSGNTESVRLLLESGADIYERDAENKVTGYVKDKAGKTVLEYATEDVRNYLTAWINEHQSLEREATAAAMQEQRKEYEVKVGSETGRARRRSGRNKPTGNSGKRSQSGGNSNRKRRVKNKTETITPQDWLRLQRIIRDPGTQNA